MTMNTLNNEQMDAIRKKIVLDRFGQGDDIAEGAYFLATSTYITGTILTIDGGLSLVF